MVSGLHGRAEKWTGAFGLVTGASWGPSALPPSPWAPLGSCVKPTASTHRALWARGGKIMSVIIEIFRELLPGLARYHGGKGPLGSGMVTRTG